MKQVLRRYTDLRADKSVLHEPIHTFNLQRVSSLADNIEAPTIRASTEPAIIASVPAIVDNPKWIPKDEQEPNRGIWRRSVLFNSTLAFPFAPTSRTETIDWAVTTVPFFASPSTSDLLIYLVHNAVCGAIPWSRQQPQI
jgi:hypothetical protein